MIAAFSNNWCGQFFNLCHSDGCIVVPHGGLINISVVTSDVEYLLMVYL